MKISRLITYFWKRILIIFKGYFFPIAIILKQNKKTQDQ